MSNRLQITVNQFAVKEEKEEEYLSICLIFRRKFPRNSSRILLEISARVIDRLPIEMPLRRNHCSWKFHSLYFPTAVNRAIKLGISRTPSASLVNRNFASDENETRHFRTAAKRRKIWKPVRVAIAENGQRSPFVFARRRWQRRRSRHYPIFRNSDAYGTADGGWRGRVTAIVASLAAKFPRVRATCATHSTPRRFALSALYYVANESVSYDDDFRLSS